MNISKDVVGILYDPLEAFARRRELPSIKYFRTEQGEGALTQLSMVNSEHPNKDLELFRRAGFRKIRMTNDRFRNSLKRMEYWKYGYHGRKFRVITWKESGKRDTI